MFLLLLLAYLAHNATQAFTLPLERQSQSEALFPRLGNQYFDDRSVLGTGMDETVPYLYLIRIYPICCYPPTKIEVGPQIWHNF